MCFVFFVCGDDDIEVGGPRIFTCAALKRYLIFSIGWWCMVPQINSEEDEMIYETYQTLYGEMLSLKLIAEKRLPEEYLENHYVRDLLGELSEGKTQNFQEIVLLMVKVGADTIDVLYRTTEELFDGSCKFCGIQPVGEIVLDRDSTIAYKEGHEGIVHDAKDVRDKIRKIYEYYSDTIPSILEKSSDTDKQVYASCLRESGVAFDEYLSKIDGTCKLFKELNDKVSAAIESRIEYLDKSRSLF